MYFTLFHQPFLKGTIHLVVLIIVSTCIPLCTTPVDLFPKSRIEPFPELYE